VITRLLKRIERAGFLIFFLGMFLAAIGITQDVAILRDIGLVVLVVTIVTIIVKARRDVTGKPHRIQPSQPSSTTQPADRPKPSERLPGRPGDPDTV